MNRSIFIACIGVASFSLVGCQGATSSVSTTQKTSATSASAAPARTELQTRLESILTRLSSTGAVVSARVVDPETKAELFALEEDRPMIPASNMKLTVTSAALDFFGPDATFNTNLMVVGQDLWLVGTGDPATGDEAIARKYGKTTTSLFDAWADELRAKGITSLSGNLYYVDSAFERLQVHPDWDADDRIEWYAAPVGGLNLNDNCIDTTVTPTEPARPGEIEVVPETTSTVVIVNNSQTIPRDAATTRPGASTAPTAQTLEIARAPDQNLFTVSGTVGRVTKLQSKPVTDPGLFFADALRTHLARQGISLGGATVRREQLPTGTVVKLKPAMSKITDVLSRVNKNSQNLLAEGMAKLLGRAYVQKVKNDPAAVGSWANADLAIRAFFRKHGIDERGFTFADGSGLSRNDRVTTRLMSDILVTMYRHPQFETFRDSLTIAGVDGTTRSRFKDLPNRVYCKTGYIGGVRSLSGYAKTDAGKWIVFSIIYNQIPKPGMGATKPYEDLQDEAVRELIRSVGAQ